MFCDIIFLNYRGVVDLDKYYKILGLNRGASKREIKKKYKELVQEYHPDKHFNTPYYHSAEEEFKRITEAYKQLLNHDSFNLDRVGNAHCKHHPDTVARGKCVFCGSLLCDGCDYGHGVTACKVCIEEYNAKYDKHLKIPIFSSFLVVILGVIVANVIAFLSPAVGNFYLSVAIIIYFLGILWSYDIIDHYNKSSKLGIILRWIFILLLGWIIGFFTTLIKVITAIFRYFKSN